MECDCPMKFPVIEKEIVLDMTEEQLFRDTNYSSTRNILPKWKNNDCEDRILAFHLGQYTIAYCVKTEI